MYKVLLGNAKMWKKNMLFITMSWKIQGIFISINDSVKVGQNKERKKGKTLKPVYLQWYFYFFCLELNVYCVLW